MVAGIAEGLGAELARTFFAAGYRVAGISRKAAPPTSLVSLTGGTVPAYLHCAGDVTIPETISRCFRDIGSRLGAPTVVVYNPMRLLVKPFLELAAVDFEDVWKTTCLGAAVVSREALPLMLKAGGGTLVFTGATASIRGSASFASLAVAKFGLRALAQSLARELGPAGIHVVHAVIDGLIWSPQTELRFAPARESCIEPAVIAEIYLQLAGQPRSAWTHEFDLRPAAAKF